MEVVGTCIRRHLPVLDKQDTSLVFLVSDTLRQGCMMLSAGMFPEAQCSGTRKLLWLIDACHAIMLWLLCNTLYLIGLAVVTLSYDRKVSSSEHLVF